MGTTIVAAVVRGRELLLANVGDSRAYMLRQGKVAQATRDHSFVADQVRAGLLTTEEARVHPQRNVITRALGSRPEVQVDTYNGELRSGDTLLLCSDGLSEYVHEEDMLAAMQGAAPAESVQQMIEMARERGGSDNITALVVQAEAPGDGATTVPAMSAATRQPSGTRPERRIPWLAVGVAAAGVIGLAILAIALFVYPRLGPRPAVQSTMLPSSTEEIEATVARTAEPTSTAPSATVEGASVGFALQQPADGAVVPAGQVEFRWEWGGPAPDGLVRVASSRVRDGLQLPLTSPYRIPT
jgi:hypothetical protein